MKKQIPVLCAILLLNACIPLRIAPTIDDYKITKGKKFKRSLPKRQMFIFKDEKEAGEFYDYVNTKYGLDNENVYDDVPFKIDGEQYFFSFYEVEIPNKSLNLIPLFIDGVLQEAANMEPMFEELHTSRKGNWYIAVEVYNDTEKDCLDMASLSRETVLKYLRALKKEYTSIHNYNEVVFKN